MKSKTAILLAMAVPLVACKEKEAEVPKAVEIPEESTPMAPTATPAISVPSTGMPEDENSGPIAAEGEEVRIGGSGEELLEEGPTAGERLDHAIDATGRGLKTAGEKTVEGVGVAAEKTGEALQTAGEKTEEGVKKGVQATGRFFKKVGEKLEGAVEDEEEEP